MFLRTGVCACVLNCCYRPAKKLLTHSLTHAGHVAVAELQPLPRPGRCAGVKEHSVAGAAAYRLEGLAGQLTSPSCRTTTSHLSFIGHILLSKL